MQLLIQYRIEAIQSRLDGMKVAVESSKTLKDEYALHRRNLIPRLTTEQPGQTESHA